MSGVASGKLEKAVIHVENGEKLEVQFNPAEISISRSVTLGSKQSVTSGDNTQAADKKNPAPQVLNTNYSTMSVTLYFDASISSGQQVETVKQVNDSLKKMATLLFYLDETHNPPKVEFIWGSALSFYGIVSSSEVRYNMFGKDGTPIRAQVTLTLTGEERAVLQQMKSRTPNSPDRTKERLLLQGEAMWVLAHQEYGNPGLWKEIAHENKILNPRGINRTVQLKVPSIR